MRLRRNPALRRSTAMVGVVAAVLVASYIVLQAFTLSGAQRVERDLGRFDTALDTSQFVGVSPGPSDIVSAAAAAGRAGGADEVETQLSSFSVDVPGQAQGSVTTYRESGWVNEPFPDRYSLVEGRWPTAPGEAVLSATLLPEVQQSSLALFSGGETLDVVGTVTDRFGAGALILAAPGTFATWDGEQLAARFPGTDALLTVFWTGGVTSEISANIVAATENPTGQTDAAEGFLVTRSTVLADDERTATQRSPLAFNLPAAALPLLSVLAVFGVNSRRLGGTVHLLQSLGMSSRGARATLGCAVTSAALVATVVGSVAGLALGAVLRPLCALVAVPPISPFPPVLRLLVVVVGLTAASCVIASLLLVLGGPGLAERASRVTDRGPRTHVPTESVSRRSGTVRRWAAVVVGGGAVVSLARLETIPAAMTLSGAVVVVMILLIPDATRAVIHRLPERGARRRLARRQLLDAPRRAVAAVSVLAAALAFFSAFAILLASLISEEQANSTIVAAPGQVVVADPASIAVPPPPEVVEAVRTVLPADRPLAVGLMFSETVSVEVAGEGPGTVLVVDSPEAAEALNNAPLTVEHRAVLNDGGMLDWAGSGDEPRVLQEYDFLTGAPLRTVSVPAAAIEFQPPWTYTANGVMLSSTADQLDLPVTQNQVVYTDISDADAAAAKAAAVAAGFDRRTVGVYEPLPPVPVPPAFYAIALGLGLMVLLTVLAVVRAQTATLRSYLGRLVSLGLTTGWARGVVLIELAVVLGLSLVLGLGSAFLAIAASSIRIPPLELVLPWNWLAGIITAFIAAAIVAALLTTTRLSPQDRLTFQ